jgi:23S rRNA (uracil1939-C5)-methyltransferase
MSSPSAIRELDVERLTNGPDALAREPEGRVVFLDGGLPGERVEAEIVEDRRDFARARVVRLLEPPGPSPHRRVPPCPVVKVCGGCPWQHVDHAEQLKLREEVVLRELWRQARIAPQVVHPAASGPEWRTRNRIRLAIARRSGPREPLVGFRGRGSHDVVAIEDCVVSHPMLVGALPLARAFARLVSAASEVELLVDDASGLRLRGFVASSDPIEAEPVLEALRREARGHDLRGATLAGLSLEPLRRRDAGPGWRRTAGDVEQRIEVQAGVVLRVPLGVFTQVNLTLNRALVAEVLERVGPVRSVADLYAGCGNFSIPLALTGIDVLGIEGDAVAVRAAIAAAREHGVASRARFEARAVEATVAGGALSRGFEVVVLDPPRAGAGTAVASIAKARVGRVVYVSCDVASFSRDAAALHRAGYECEGLRLLDLTPQTYRAEVVGVFRLT